MPASVIIMEKDKNPDEIKPQSSKMVMYHLYLVTIIYP